MSRASAAALWRLPLLLWAYLGLFSEPTAGVAHARPATWIGRHAADAGGTDAGAGARERAGGGRAVRGRIHDATRHEAVVDVAAAVQDDNEIVVFGLTTGPDRGLFEQLTFLATVIRNWRAVTGRRNELVVAIEPRDCRRFLDHTTDDTLRDVTCVTHANAENAHMDPNFRLWALRYRFAARLVQLGYNVLMCDTDVRFFADPYPFLHAPPLNETHLLYMRDPKGSASAINGGFTYARGSAVDPAGPVAWVLHEAWRRAHRHKAAGLGPLGYNLMDQQAMQESLMSAMLGVQLFPWSLSTGTAEFFDLSLLYDLRRAPKLVERRDPKVQFNDAKFNDGLHDSVRDAIGWHANCTQETLKASSVWFSCGGTIVDIEQTAIVNLTAADRDAWTWFPNAYDTEWRMSQAFRLTEDDGETERPFKLALRLPAGIGPIDPWAAVRRELVGDDATDTVRHVLGGLPAAFEGEPASFNAVRPDVMEYASPFPGWFVQGSNCTFQPRCSRRLAHSRHGIRRTPGPPSVALHTVGHCCRRMLWKAYGWWDSRLEEGYLPSSIELVKVHVANLTLPALTDAPVMIRQADTPALLRTYETLKVATPFFLAFSPAALKSLEALTREDIHVQFGALAALAIMAERLPVFAALPCASAAWRTWQNASITSTINVTDASGDGALMRGVHDMPLAWERPWSRTPTECLYLPMMDERMCKAHMPWLSTEPLVRRLRQHHATMRTVDERRLLEHPEQFQGGPPLLEVTGLFPLSGVDGANALALRSRYNPLWRSRLCRALLLPVLPLDTKDQHGNAQVACFDSAPCMEIGEYLGKM